MKNFDVKNARNLTMLVDFYELTMGNGYFKNGLENKIAYFDMYFRRVPDGGGYCIMAGLDQLIDYLLNLTAKKIIIPESHTINLNEIGTRLKNIRTSLNLSLRDLGKKLNCSFSAFAAYERGEKLINSEILVSFAILSNHSIDYILGRTPTKNLLIDKKKR